MLEEEESNEDIINQAKTMIRAVLWVSLLDNTGGRASQLEERKALIEEIRRFTREKDYRPLNPVLEIALENHKAWDSWARDLSNLTRELPSRVTAMSLIERQCIYDLAYVIAARFRERNVLSSLLIGIEASFKNFLRPSHDKLIISEYVNISAIEKSALNELAVILNLPRKIIR